MPRGSNPLQALAASVITAGTAAGLSGRPYPKRPDRAAFEILAGSTPGFASWLTRSREADLRLITDDAGAARVLDHDCPGLRRLVLQVGGCDVYYTQANVVGEVARSWGSR